MSWASWSKSKLELITPCSSPLVVFSFSFPPKKYLVRFPNCHGCLPEASGLGNLTRNTWHRAPPHQARSPTPLGQKVQTWKKLIFISFQIFSPGGKTATSVGEKWNAGTATKFRSERVSAGFGADCVSLALYAFTLRFLVHLPLDSCTFALRFLYIYP